MGFFSYECQGCNRSVLAPYGGADPRLSHTVVIKPDGSTFAGTYDGYGRVGYNDLGIPDFKNVAGEHPMRGYNVCPDSVWHHACWVLSDEPGFTGPSANADDQGYIGFSEADGYDGWEPQAALPTCVCCEKTGNACDGTGLACLRPLLEDQPAVGTDRYRGVAYFWHHDYRHYLRDATRKQRRHAHHAMLNSGLRVDGNTTVHEAIISRATARRVSDV